MDGEVLIKEWLLPIVDNMHNYIWVLIMVILKLNLIWKFLAHKVNKTCLGMVVLIQNSFFGSCS